MNSKSPIKKEPALLLLALAQVGWLRLDLLRRPPHRQPVWTPAGWATSVLMAGSGHLGKGKGMGWAEGGAEWHQSNPSWCPMDLEQGKGRRNQGSDQKLAQRKAAEGVWIVLVRAATRGQMCPAFTPTFVACLHLFEPF